MAEEKYWRLVLRDALEHWRGETFDNWGRRMIGFIVESATLFLLLYFMPVLGDVKGEERLWVAGAISLVAGGVLLFAWDLISAPKRLHAKMDKRLRVRQEIIANFWEAERGLRILAALYREGRALYEDRQPPQIYFQRFEEWEARVSNVLSERFSVSDLFKFQNNDYGAWFTLDDPVEEGWEQATKERRITFTSRMKALHNMIEFGGGTFLDATFAIRDLLKDEKDAGISPLPAVASGSLSQRGIELSKQP